MKLIPQTTTYEPILRVYHGLDGWGVTVQTLEEMLCAVGLDPQEPDVAWCRQHILPRARAAVDELLRDGDYVDADAAEYYFRTDRPDAVRVQWDAIRVGLEAV